MLRRRELFRRQKAVVINEHNEDSGLSRDIPSIESDSSPKGHGMVEGTELAGHFQFQCQVDTAQRQKQPPVSVPPLPQPPTPTPQRKPAFSLPRLFLPKSSKRAPSASASVHSNNAPVTVPPDEPQPSPSTTTSAYNTGGDTGQESPVEKTRQQQQTKRKSPPESQQQQKGVQDPRGGPIGGGQIRQIPPSPTLRTRHASPANPKPSQKQRVRFETEETPPLPQAVFYTSTERLAETIAAQQRLLRLELYEDVEEKGAEVMQSSTTSRKVAGRPPPATKPTAAVYASRHIVGPKTPSVHSLAVPAQNRQGTPQLERRDGTPLVGHPSVASTVSFCQRRQSANTDKPDQYPMVRPNWPQPDELAQLFAFKSEHSRGDQQVREKRRGSPSKQISGQHRQQPEMEWIVKRRPDGTRYVTRRSVRKRATPFLAGVKARREQSLQRERAGMSTTDDDGGSEVGGGGVPRWWTQRRRKPPPAPPANPPAPNNRARVVHFGQMEANPTTAAKANNGKTKFSVTTV